LLILLFVGENPLVFSTIKVELDHEKAFMY